MVSATGGKGAWDAGGVRRWRVKGRRAKSKLTPDQTQQVTEALLAGPAVYGYKTPLDFATRRVAYRRPDGGLIIILVTSGDCSGPVVSVANGPERRAIERDAKAVRRWHRAEWPALKKGPTQRRTIVFNRRKRTHLGTRGNPGAAPRPSTGKAFRSSAAWRSGGSISRFTPAASKPPSRRVLNHLQRHLRGKSWSSGMAHRSIVVCWSKLRCGHQGAHRGGTAARLTRLNSIPVDICGAPQNT